MKGLKLYLAVLTPLLFMGMTVFADTDKSSPSGEAIIKRQKAEFLNYYLESPEKARLPQTNISIERYNQAAEYFRKQDYPLAEEALREAIAYDNRNSYAHELMGDVAYVKGQFEQAVSHYKDAYRLDSRPSLKDKLEKIMKEVTIQEQFVNYADRHFVLKHREKMDPEAVRRLKRLLRQSYRVISKNWGYYFKRPIVVVLYKEKEFKEITALPHWISGVYDGIIRLPAESRRLPEAGLKAMIYHEMAHAFVAAASERQAPAWIHEGLAIFEENKVKQKELIVFNAAVKTNTLLALDQLMTERKAAIHQDALFTSLFYEESFQLVKYMIERFGFVQIKRILAEFAKGKNSDEALREALDLSAADLEREWKTTLIK